MPLRPRRKSVDSSSSSSSDSDSNSPRKAKMSGASDFGGAHSPGSVPSIPNFPTPNHGFEGEHERGFVGVAPEFPTRAPDFPQASPPPYAPVQPTPPASGYRVPLTTTATTFPDEKQTGRPAFHDADGVSPIFIGSALFERSVHPCKIGPHLQSFVSVPYGGGEHVHTGRYDLLPFSPDLMEWVPHLMGGFLLEGALLKEGMKRMAPDCIMLSAASTEFPSLESVVNICVGAGSLSEVLNIRLTKTMKYCAGGIEDWNKHM